jgi:hypothetical protein
MVPLLGPANVGLAVMKDIDEEIRLTCPAHVFDKVSAKLGYHSTTVVGELEQTFGEDIGLINPVASLSNEFLSIECVAKRFINSNSIPDDGIVPSGFMLHWPTTHAVLGYKDW